MRSRASRKTPDVSSFFHRPTAPHLAVFILPSIGRLISHRWPHCQTYENMRHSATDDQTSHHRLRSDDLGTKRLSAGGFGVVSVARPGADDCFSLGSRSWFCISADVLSGFAGFAGNNALDQTRARSSDVSSGAVGAACGSRVRVSDARSLGSKYASFGISKFGALPFSTVARTAFANPVSGRSHEPR